MADIIQVRRDTAANWTSVNPTLAQGEFAVETDTNQFKIGDGVTAWTGLAYVTQGPAATVAVGTTTTGAEGTNASVANSGNSAAAVFDFTIPRGDTGAQGPQGDAATIAVGTTTTGAEGTNASVVNSGTSGSAVFDFTIPRGDTGATGPQGPQGIQGPQGPQGDPGTPGNLWTLNGLTAEYLAGSIQVGGLVYATGGDSGEWNDAFSWGDHALAGYAQANGSNATGTWGISISGNAATATTFSTTNANYKGVTDNAVCGQLMWKNYGNNHTIFDASNGTAPNGTSISQSDAGVAWTPSYPTLMGWNGSNTYGVRVDSARISGDCSRIPLSTSNYGTIKVNDDRGVTWAGYAIRDDWVFMSNGAGQCGIYDDTNNRWAIEWKNNTETKVTGYLTCTGNITAYSDERLKSDIQTLDGTKVFDMRGTSYIKDGELSSGVIAQELQKVAPELVHEGGEYLSVAYGNLVGYLIEAVKHLNERVKELEDGVTDKRADKS